MHSPPSSDRTDRVVGGLLFTAAFAFLAAFPRDLGMSDESYFLYEAARIRNGEVMYRDVFQFITPLSAYAMAALFWLFGTSIDTARLSMAALHGSTVLVLYLLCRRVGVRYSLGAVTAASYLAICQPAWPYASWHWYSTLLTTILLLAVLARPRAATDRWSFAVGVINGILIGIQQQKGVIMAAGVCSIIAIDHLIIRRHTAAGPGGTLISRLLYFAAGVSAIVAPLIAVSIALAGATPVYDALVRWPLETYGAHFEVSWGRLALLATSFADRTFPTLLKYSPIVVAPLLARCIALCPAALSTNGRERRQVRTLMVLIVFAAFSALSISYYPDVIHIAFIAPVFLLCFAELVEWALRTIAPARSSAAIAWATAVVAFIALASTLSATLAGARREFPIRQETEFGEVAFAHRWRAIMIEHLRDVLKEVPSRELYCYANISSPYLTAGGNNPTPYQFFISSISPAYQLERVLAEMRRSRPPYVLGAPFFMHPDDPVVRYIEKHYEAVEIQALEDLGEPSGLKLFRRRDWRPSESPSAAPGIAS